MKTNKLTPEEDYVINQKGTEPPFTGKYFQHKEAGTYTCRKCDTPLYRSSDKFESNCGWPSFDDEVPGAVNRTTDADGVRIEITCSNCDGHLGHVFLGERLTEKNVRHCVNSLSIGFEPSTQGAEVQVAYFVGGCFWGTEHLFQTKEGVLSTRVGYMGGEDDSPSYELVCSGQSGHAEALEVRFDTSQTSYEVLARFFFEIHDPTQINRQGPDIGEQYRSAVYYTDEDQKKTIEKLIELLKEKGYPVVTKLEQVDTFWEAEVYHQKYYDKTGKQPYCHFYQKRF